MRSNRSVIRAGFRKEKAFQAARVLAIGPRLDPNVGGGEASIHTDSRTHIHTLHACTYHERDMKPAQRGVAERSEHRWEFRREVRGSNGMEWNGMEWNGMEWNGSWRICCVAHLPVYVRGRVTTASVCVHVHALAHCAHGVLCRLYGIRCRRSRPTALDACASLFPLARVWLMLSRGRASPLCLLLVIDRDKNWKKSKFLGGRRKVMIDLVGGLLTLENPRRTPFDR